MNNRFNQEITLRLLKILAEEPKLTQRAMAKQMGISLGKVNYCVSELAKKGFIKVKRFQGARNKAPYAYVLTPQGVEEKARMTVRFLKRKIREYEEIKRQIQDLSAELPEDTLEDIEARKTLEALN